MHSKKRYLLLALILLLIPVTYAQDSSKIYHSEYLILNLDMSNYLSIVPTSASTPQAEHISADISFYPRNTEYQTVLEKRLTPLTTELEDNSLRFTWINPTKTDLQLEMKYKVKIMNRPKRIFKKVPFPVTNIPQNIKHYTYPAEIIDYNDDIIKLSSSLANGEDDLTIVVDKIAKWVTTNIKYNISTATSEASQKASWVLVNKQGVCDELTSLFISMLRSVGIPARFVAGIAYTDSELFDQKWGPHGWAEVYFPDYGWIPYDVTYGEYGYVDPSHITAKYSTDAGKITSKYSWRGKNMEVKVDKFQTDVTVEEYGKQLSPKISIEMELLKGSIGFGSYNLVQATVKNLVSYYQPIDVYVSKTDKLLVLGEHKQHLLLAPNQETQVFWIVKVDDDLDAGYIYTFPVSVYSKGEIQAKEEFKAIEGGIDISKTRAEKTIEELKQDKTKFLSSNIDLLCNLDKIEYYTDDSAKVTCKIKNSGNIMLEDLNICLGKDCKKESIGISQEKQIEFDVLEKPIGVNELIITAENIQISKSSILEMYVMDKSSVEITDLQYPQTITYEEPYATAFTISKLSQSSPMDVQILFSFNDLSKKFSIEELKIDQDFKINLLGKDLKPGKNRFNIEVNYKDKKGNDYRAVKGFDVYLENVTFWQRVKIFFVGIANKIESWF